MALGANVRVINSLSNLQETWSLRPGIYTMSSACPAAFTQKHMYCAAALLFIGPGLPILSTCTAPPRCFDGQDLCSPAVESHATCSAEARGAKEEFTGRRGIGKGGHTVMRQD